ncbi:MAG: hypothetical protein ACJ768_19610 [Gaiellaceae bacterium]
MIAAPKDPSVDMIAQSPSGDGASYIKPPTMTSGGAVLQPPTSSTPMPAPTASQLSPSAKPADATPRQPATTQLAPAPAPAAAPGAPAPPSVGTPGATAPASSAANLATSAPGATAGGDGLASLFAQLQGEAGRQLMQPTAWDDSLASSIVSQQKRGVDENFQKAGDSLNAELAQRGLDFSSIAGSRNVDLATRHAQALGDVDTNIAHERANALAAGRSSAFGNASQVAGQLAGIGQQDYENNLQSILAQHGLDMQDDEAWQQAILSGLNYGQGSAGAQALSGAASINNATGSQYGEQAAGDNAGLSTLAQMAMQFYGGQQ